MFVFYCHFSLQNSKQANVLPVGKRQPSPTDTKYVDGALLSVWRDNNVLVKKHKFTLPLKSEHDSDIIATGKGKICVYKNQSTIL